LQRSFFSKNKPEESKYNLKKELKAYCNETIQSLFVWFFGLTFKKMKRVINATTEKEEAKITVSGK